MTKELLEKRLQALQANYDQAIAQVNAFEGAILECRYWLKELEKEKSDESNVKDIKQSR